MRQEPGRRPSAGLEMDVRRFVLNEGHLNGQRLEPTAGFFLYLPAHPLANPKEMS